MSGVKGRSGRKRNVRNATKYFTELYDDKAFELAEVTINKALAGDRELLIYCHDRRLGKPKQQTEITGGKTLGAGVVVEILKVIQEKRRELDTRVYIEGGDDGQDSEGEDEALP